MTNKETAFCVESLWRNALQQDVLRVSQLMRESMREFVRVCEVRSLPEDKKDAEIPPRSKKKTRSVSVDHVLRW